MLCAVVQVVSCTRTLVRGAHAQLPKLSPLCAWGCVPLEEGFYVMVLTPNLAVRGSMSRDSSGE